MAKPRVLRAGISSTNTLVTTVPKGLRLCHGQQHRNPAKVRDHRHQHIMKKRRVFIVDSGGISESIYRKSISLKQYLTVNLLMSNHGKYKGLTQCEDQIEST
ncbi:hypothetical protein STAS_26905 [Striga asiatica]|uniref:Uncharacterized protein n=1 Tax=Striga asiatica TaxID=4170 RepID=A0A5A7QWN2_STRAF|nr:hypothetical protein STAS_26905 [Striga asiatica]